ncbi:efflux RND transporter permease subunit [Acidicapsa dinghuensis]|uniref:Efflux RND transporter permease subunit n=1 Tax=Acidicapsa dinghuensis TaxID=2218256 RepID=A0ABW1EP76_9BACT|nr:efflux RND transporter permease subunit [Acidicapsa dinghuensis]
MWIVRIALDRPYTFIVLALLILILSPVIIMRTPVDMFPAIDIPVISLGWQYTGLNPEELEGRLTTPFEKSLSNFIDNVEHIESTTYNGFVVVRVYLQPGANIAAATAEASAASEYLLKQLPPGILPPEIITYSASSVPILQLGISGRGLSEQSLNDYAQNFIHPQIITVPGSVVPSAYGGKERQITINLDQAAMQSRKIAPGDLLNALATQNVVTPSGTIKIGSKEYDVRANSAPRTIQELNDLPIKQQNGVTTYLRDIAEVSDGFQVQTNIVRHNGQRGVMMSILKNGQASTISVVKGVRAILPRIAQLLPPQLQMTPIGDQSVFVSGAVNGVVREAILAAALTGLMILLFLGSWRSTLIIAVSIPLSILTSVIVLSFLGETINTMTLGGLALAVGILVDDATVTIENIERFLEEGHPLREAILEGAAQIAVPAFVSTLCICIVFLPMFFLDGVARYLFVPLAEAVIFAMLASYFLSRTLVPTLAVYLLSVKEHHKRSTSIFARFQRGFERGFLALRNSYEGLLTRLVHARVLFIPCFLAVCLLTFLLLPWLGQDFFPAVDSGQFTLHMRAPTGTRIEETARLCDEVENFIRQTVPPSEMRGILDNIGMPYSAMNTQLMNSGTVGAADADIMVSLQEDHHPTADYVRKLRLELPRRFPQATFYFLPADITAQILNFGLPAPIDIRFEGNDVKTSEQLANQILPQLQRVPGLADIRIQQPFDYPTLDIDVERTKAAQGGYTERDVTTSVLNTLSGSFQLSPMFFLNWHNHVNYNMVAQTPQYKMDSLSDLQNIPINRASETSPANPQGDEGSEASRPSEMLGDVAQIHRNEEMAVVSHYNTRRVVDIYASVQDRGLGAAANDVQKIVDSIRKHLPRGTFVDLRGQVETMRHSYTELVGGLVFSIVLIYMLIVVNFQSWLDPFVIITALPAALAGIVVFLFFTHTRLSVPALMGAIMCMGVATANSILVVSFAKTKLQEHGDAVRAAIEAGATRFRPVIMTALAMIIGMVPMSLGLGDGGEQNAPLGRAVIGGLICATIATLNFVPAVFALVHHGKSHRAAQPSVETDTQFA